MRDEFNVQVTIDVPWYFAGILSTLAAILVGDPESEVGEDEQRAIRVLLDSAANICHPSYFVAVAELLEAKAAAFRDMKTRYEAAQPPAP